MSSQLPRIHLLVSDLYPGDAIGNFVLAIHRFLVSRDVPAQIYAERYDPTLQGIEPYTTFFTTTRSNDTLFYQLSNHEPALPELMKTPCRKVVYYHNITPGEFFAPYSPHTASLLDKGHAELFFVKSADLLLANSHYSLAEVEPYLPPAVPRAFFPPFLQSQIFDLSSPTPSTSASTSPYLLVLGRVVPHKRIEDAIRIFSLLQAMLPAMNLIIAGAQYEPYSQKLMEIIQASPSLSPHVVFTGKLPRKEVISLLHNASGLLHTSAHEGFCMPVFEAMLMGTPVFACKQRAVAETLEGTGVLLDAAFPERSAKLIRDIVLTPYTRSRLIAEQQKRAKNIISLAKEDLLFEFLKPLTG